MHTHVCVQSTRGGCGTFLPAPSLLPRGPKQTGAGEEVWLLLLLLALLAWMQEPVVVREAAAPTPRPAGCKHTAPGRALMCQHPVHGVRWRPRPGMCCRAHAEEKSCSKQTLHRCTAPRGSTLLSLVCFFVFSLAAVVKDNITCLLFVPHPQRLKWHNTTV